MGWHKHECICGKIFNCRMDIVPTGDHHHRAWCKEWVDSICDQCLSNILENQGPEIFKDLMASEHWDPSTSYRIKLLLSANRTATPT
jgi:hypothetical protein